MAHPRLAHATNRRFSSTLETSPSNGPSPTAAPRLFPDVIAYDALLPLAVEEYNLRLGAHAWKILHTGAILSREDERRLLGGEQPRVPYGIVLWPAAIALAHEIASRQVAGMRVLELGAGTGLPGIVAASLGAHVVQTDKQELALFVCKKNAERNGVTTIQHRAADWTAWEDREAYDLIIGADVLYADTMHPHLRAISERNLA